LKKTKQEHKKEFIPPVSQEENRRKAAYTCSGTSTIGAWPGAGIPAAAFKFKVAELHLLRLHSESETACQPFT
jgi:hypothetical protein